MEPLARTSSKDSVKSPLSPRSLSASPTSLSTPVTRKGQSLDPGTTPGNVDRAIISMPPAASVSVARQYPSVPSRNLSRSFNSNKATIKEADATTTAPPAAEDAENSDDTTPTLEGNPIPHSTPPLMLPEAALRPGKPRDPETESNRLSFSSLYSLGSAIYDRARGVGVSGASSAAESESERKGFTLWKLQA
jgi:inositol-hexakisphosphate/diphosphoinositol-pentakisphosphate 1-kinase